MHASVIALVPNMTRKAYGEEDLVLCQEVGTAHNKIELPLGLDKLSFTSPALLSALRDFVGA